MALIAGVTGIVGNSLAAQLHDPNAPGGPWKVYGVARRATKPDRLAERLHFINCNLLGRDETLSKLSPLHDARDPFVLRDMGEQTHRGRELRSQRRTVSQRSRCYLTERQELPARCVADGEQTLHRSQLDM